MRRCTRSVIMPVTKVSQQAFVLLLAFVNAIGQTCLPEVRRPSLKTTYGTRKSRKTGTLVKNPDADMILQSGLQK